MAVSLSGKRNRAPGPVSSLSIQLPLQPKRQRSAGEATVFARSCSIPAMQPGLPSGCVLGVPCKLPLPAPIAGPVPGVPAALLAGMPTTIPPYMMAMMQQAMQQQQMQAMQQQQMQAAMQQHMAMTCGNMLSMPSCFPPGMPMSMGWGNMHPAAAMMCMPTSMPCAAMDVALPNSTFTPLSAVPTPAWDVASASPGTSTYTLPSLGPHHPLTVAKTSKGMGMGSVQHASPPHTYTPWGSGVSDATLVLTATAGPGGDSGDPDVDIHSSGCYSHHCYSHHSCGEGQDVGDVGEGLGSLVDAELASFMDSFGFGGMEMELGMGMGPSCDSVPDLASLISSQPPIGLAEAPLGSLLPQETVCAALLGLEDEMAFAPLGVA